MSHEIRTPMNAILGFSDLLVTELPEGRGRRRVQAIRESANSLLQLINDILDLSKIDAGVVELRPEPTDLREVADFMQTVFAQQAARRGLQLHAELEPSLPHAIMLDRSRLRQILVNLIGNALKFTERGRVDLGIRWRQEPGERGCGELLVEVADTGIGIPPEKQREIFHPFVQVNPRRASEQQGSGLGLSIVHRLTERMGGTVSLESEVGQGTRFRLKFPQVPVSMRLPAHVRADRVEEVDFNDLQRADILVVDDAESNRELIAGYLENSDHQVRFALNGREALEKIGARLPDVVLMDIRMPEMDGHTALMELRKLPGTELLPVIAVTASSMLDDEHVMRGYFAGYMRKPYTRQMLFHELAAFLPRRARRGPAVAEPLPSPPAGRPPTTSWTELAPALRHLEAGVWREACDSGAINDVREFARVLDEVARAFSSQPVAEYAAALLRDADDYSVLRIETRLKEFPSLIQSVEPRPASAI
ncbi:MAG TPA: ATP-binding protein, partial [Opitutus sp.]|nr:ATP-binding protein [Opitutus sp.]